jgi:hypothetical protein
VGPILGPSTEGLHPRVEDVDESSDEEEGTPVGRSHPPPLLPEAVIRSIDGSPAQVSSTLPSPPLMNPLSMASLGSLSANDMQVQMLQMMAALVQSQQQNQLLMAEFARGRAVSVGPSSSKDPNASPPSHFNGTDGTKLRSFIQQCNIVFKINASRFANDDVRIAYVTSYLRGSALESVRIFDGMYPIPLELSSLENFYEYLSQSFGDPDEEGTARRSLRDLEQRGSASEYFAKFREYIAILGWSPNEPSVVARATEGLSWKMKEELARKSKPFKSVDTLARFVIPLDNITRAVAKDKERKERIVVKSNDISVSPSIVTVRPRVRFAGTNIPSSSIDASGSSVPLTTSPIGTKMYMDRSGTSYPKASQEERDRRKSEGLCYRCGGSGHIGAGCPAYGDNDVDGQAPKG